MRALKHKTVIIFLSLICMLFGCGATAFAAEYSTTVENNLDIGLVNIHLDQYEYTDNNQLVQCSTYKEVLPGEQVNRVVHVTNAANSAWVRLKITFDNVDSLSGVGEEMLVGVNKDWVRRGDYFYWTKPLNTGDGVYFDNSVYIPTTWTNVDEYKTFKMKVSADAVQSKNFTPDFTAEDPWFGTVIEQALYEDYTERIVNPDKNFSVVFKGGAEGLVRLGDDFFGNWSTLMPGDVMSDKATISSNYEKPVKMWFYSQTDSLNNKTDLADRITLTIKNNDSVIYQGPLSGTANKTLLGEYSKGNNSSFTYTIDIPKELTNEYALSNAKTIWVFECETPDTPNSPTPNPPGVTPGPVKTGDNSMWMIYLSMITASACILYVIYCKKSAQKQQNKH